MALFGPTAPLGTYLTFQGIGLHSNDRRFVSVMCGDIPPQPTDGWAIWQTINRPLLRGVPVPQGYNPAAMDVNVRFGVWDARFATGPDTGHYGWDKSAEAGRWVEGQIATLEWMAGAGFMQGPSPVVYVSAFYATQYPGVPKNQKQSALVPPTYQDKPWVINGGLKWGTTYREKEGNRVWAECSFSLLQYLNFAGGPNAPKSQGSNHGGNFTSKPGADTPLLIAAAASGGTPEAYIYILAGRICQAGQNNPLRGSKIRLERKPLHYQIRHGLKVWVPEHQV